MGVLHIGIANGGYINVCEYVHDRWKNVVCTTMLVFDMLTVIFGAIYWKYISIDASWYLIFGISQNALGLIGCVFLPETPEYLYSFKRFRECKEVMHMIAKVNRSEAYFQSLTKPLYNSVRPVAKEEGLDEDETVSLTLHPVAKEEGLDKDESVSLTQVEGADDDSMVFNYQFDVEADLKQIVWERMIAEKNDKYIYSLEKGNEYKIETEIQRSVRATIREFLKNKAFVINLLLNMIIWGITDMNYQINDYYPNFFPHNDSYLQTIAIGTVETFGYIFASVMFEVFKSKPTIKSYIVSFTIALAGAFWMIFNDSETYPYRDMASNYIVKFGIAAVFQTCFLSNDLFPLVFSSTTFGLCSMMCSISSVFSIYIIYKEMNPAVWVWHFFIGFGFVGLLCSVLQKED